MNRIKQWCTTTLQGKMVATFSLFLPIVIFLIGMTLSMWIQRTSRENLLEKYAVVDQGVVGELMMLKRNDESLINSLGQSVRIQKVLTDLPPGGVLANLELYREVQALCDASVSSGSITGICLTGRNGTRFFSTNMLDLPSVDPESWIMLYAKAAEQPRKARWLVSMEDYFSDSNRSAYLYIVNTIPIRISLRETIGISVARVSYPRYMNTLRYTLSSPEEYAFVLDENGDILVHSHDRTKTGRPPEEGIAPYIKQENAVVEAKALGGVFLHTREAGSRWTIVHFVPNTALNEVPQSYFVFIWVIMLLSFIVMMTGLSGFSRTITTPLHRLAVALRRFGAGKLEERIPESKRQDEIGELETQFNDMADALTQYMFLMEESHAARAKLEMRVLENQINPHFLYNVLDLINWKAKHAGQQDISEMTVHLARFFRIGLHMGRDFITIADELEHAKEYLYICKMRYKDCFSFTVTADPQLLKYKTKKILLQPMLENCIKYGIRPDSRHNRLSITVADDGDYILLSVADNGPGMSAETLGLVRARMYASGVEEETGSFGLYNLNARLSVAYKDDFTLILQSEPGEGTTVSIRLPKRK